MSALVAEPLGHGRSRGDRVLWEWRPPYLQGKHGGPIDRRPYVTVARVSPTLRSNLERKVGGRNGLAGRTPRNAVSSVLLRLGTEGLGLSSLLTRGGTHESGALGFYLAYELIDRGRVDTATDVVLPIDACDTFLTALGGRSTNEPGEARRPAADAVSWDRSSCSCPLRSSSMGLDRRPRTACPSPGPALKEALGQLRETTESLRRVVESH